jgi:hypothetical protein
MMMIMIIISQHSILNSCLKSFHISCTRNSWCKLAKKGLLCIHWKTIYRDT